jgi:tRNA(adenine34) deaminase
VATTNQVVQNADVTRRAELIALSEAQKRSEPKTSPRARSIRSWSLARCVFFAIRETRIGRVVFSIKSPMMGGLSKWNVLRGTEASHALPEVFGPYLR